MLSKDIELINHASEVEKQDYVCVELRNYASQATKTLVYFLGYKDLLAYQRRNATWLAENFYKLTLLDCESAELESGCVYCSPEFIKYLFVYKSDLLDGIYIERPNIGEALLLVDAIEMSLAYERTKRHAN